MPLTRAGRPYASWQGLLARPLELLTTGRFNRVPLIIGTNENEGTIFLPLAVAIIPGWLFWWRPRPVFARVPLI